MIKTIARIMLTDNDQPVMMAYDTELPFVLQEGACIRLHSQGEVYEIKDVFYDLPINTLDILLEPMNYIGSVKEHLSLGWYLAL
ncbi:MAG: hypothetical protein Q8K94_00650 [Moraxellaceae bacterium]|nr:hypothetical protein [Moraxellaceae bacterium]MDP1775102.1 hypothetical protein [Moraxellaceae bacterium]